MRFKRSSSILSFNPLPLLCTPSTTLRRFVHHRRHSRLVLMFHRDTRLHSKIAARELSIHQIKIHFAQAGR